MRDMVQLMSLAQRAGVGWISGTAYSPREAEESTARRKADDERRASLRDDLNYTLVFLDVDIQGESVGRMEFVLFTTDATMAAENFRALCTCEKGPVSETWLPEAAKFGDGKDYCLKVCWSLYETVREGCRARSRHSCWRC